MVPTSRRIRIRTQTRTQRERWRVGAKVEHDLAIQEQRCGRAVSPVEDLETQVPR